MINLEAFINKKHKILDIYKEILETSLIQGIIYNELIDVTGLRGIGKTTALINLARKAGNIPIVVSNDNIATIYKIEYKYNNTHSIYGIEGLSQKEVLIEELVNKKSLETKGFRVLTGYYSG